VDLGLRGKVAIVGGSSQGIGFAIARELAQEGAFVTITARKEANLNAARERIRAATNADVLAVPGDWTQPGDNERVVAQTLAAHGRIDILVNNDGAPPLGTLVDFDDVAWQRAIERNFLSVVRINRLAVPHMKKNRWGRIVNISATSAKQPLSGYGLSVATWSGLIGYSKTLALELAGDGITVNTILPGRILTERLEIVLRYEAEKAGISYDEMTRADNERIPVGRPGAPEDIAAMVALLVSERGGYVTGTTIQVDGGSVRGLL
jgi:3-oxoacyl-[acyl-carrier protein] reductase